MRIYLPATVESLRGDVATLASVPVGLGTAHAVTEALRAALAEGEGSGVAVDEEEAEYAALLAAADDSFVRIAADPTVPWQRVVISVDVSDDAVVVAEGEDAAPSEVRIVRALGRVPIVCVHVDEPTTAVLIAAAFSGTDEAVEALVDADLLWYEASELAHIPGVRPGE